MVVTLYFALATVLLLGRPPWEAPDEADHVQNVETIAGGSLYRIAPGGGQEAMQPPLYYAAAALWQRLWLDHPPRPQPVPALACQRAMLRGQAARCWAFQHRTVRDRSDRRLVVVLRVLGILLGAGAILLTAATATLLSRDPRTPVLAAATVAFVPTLAFDFASVNNDVLATALAALATWLAILLVVKPSSTPRRGILRCSALGVVFGALLQTKLTTAPLLPAILAAVWAAAEDARRRRQWLAALAVGALVASGWWLVHNVTLYGDPLALSATARYNRQVGPLEYAGVEPLHQALVALPASIWKQFWYGFQQFTWPWWVYLPFWGLVAVGLGGVWRRRDHRPRAKRALLVLALFALGGLLAVWVIGVQGKSAQARLAFIGLPALACLITLGFERLRAPLAVRCALPVLSFAGSAVAVGVDVVGIPG